ncbi:hypothetical protein SBA3_4780009 [Candidatus Sulfopaludibacter sp. SbA3]|nr:hypothetical protein SBA3_4780009 [Candidatus Sulfopaludibacter sp. SbA3]
MLALFVGSGSAVADRTVAEPFSTERRRLRTG